MVRKKNGFLLRASTVVEIAYLMTVILGVWMVVIFGLFYYHDKSILMGAAYETAVVGSEVLRGLEKLPEEEMEEYFRNRIRGKLLFYGQVSVDVYENEQQIIAEASAMAKGMKVHARGSAQVTDPEKKIRKVRVLRQNIEEAAK